MSKVIAYICNHCGAIREERAILGIMPTEDIFDRMSSFPFTKSLEKTTVHGCTECFNKLQDTNRENRRKDELAYMKRRAELSFMFRQQCVHNQRNNIFISTRQMKLPPADKEKYF
jgi:hypothetical protein